MKRYAISASKIVDVYNDGSKVYVKDTNNSAEALFPSHRWASFVSYLDEADEHFQRKDTTYSRHYGGAWYIFADDGTVDLRRCYMDNTGDIRRSFHGIVLNSCEWRELKQLVKRLSVEHSKLANATVHFHENFSRWLKCAECIPFLFER
jgi:hypothetical protein